MCLPQARDFRYKIVRTNILPTKIRPRTRAINAEVWVTGPLTVPTRGSDKIRCAVKVFGKVNISTTSWYQLVRVPVVRAKPNQHSKQGDHNDGSRQDRGGEEGKDDRLQFEQTRFLVPRRGKQRVLKGGKNRQKTSERVQGRERFDSVICLVSFDY